MIPSRVWVISDIHIDYRENFNHILAFANQGHQHDALIIAGDVTDVIDRLRELFQQLVRQFRYVLYVPGNHELWIRRSPFQHSVEKFQALSMLCSSLGVVTQPLLFGQYRKVWLLPLLSWYDDKDQPEYSLYRSKDYAEQDLTDSMWGDFNHARWPSDLTQPLAAWFAEENEAHLQQPFNQPVISFSHFLPRQELLFDAPLSIASRLYKWFDRFPEFNFSRVAGSLRIDEQVRRAGSLLHIYGHQHVNRVRVIQGVTYLSHCMGYPRERQRGSISSKALQPLCVWRDDTGFCYPGADRLNLGD